MKKRLNKMFCIDKIQNTDTVEMTEASAHKRLQKLP